MKLWTQSISLITGKRHRNWSLLTSSTIQIRILNGFNSILMCLSSFFMHSIWFPIINILFKWSTWSKFYLTYRWIEPFIASNFFTDTRKMQTEVSIRWTGTHSTWWQLNGLVADCRWPQSRPKPTFHRRQYTYMPRRLTPQSIWPANPREFLSRGWKKKESSKQQQKKLIRVAINGMWKKKSVDNLSIYRP